MAVASIASTRPSEPQAARRPATPPAAARGAGAPPNLLALQRTAGNTAVTGLVARKTPAPPPARVVQRAPGPPSVTLVSAPTELGVGRQLTARATVGPAGAKGSPTWALSGAPAGVTLVPSGRSAQIRSGPPVTGAPVGGASFTVTAGFTGATPIASPPILLVEVTGATFTPVPAFGGPFTTAIGTATAPANTADPNRDGVTGNTATVVPTTLPAGRTVEVTAPGKPGAAASGLTVTPRTGTGNQKLRLTERATGSFIDRPLTINSVPTKVSGFGAQTPAPAGTYGGWNTVLFGASDPSGAGSRPAAEIITTKRDDFGFPTVTGGAGTPSLAFSAPCNNWTDQNFTPTTIDVNNFEGPGVKQLPRLILYGQKFFWLSWTGTFATTALATGTHRRTLARRGAGHDFRTEQIFPGASAPTIIDAYSGPPLIVLSGITAVPTTPGATALAADGTSTANVTVTTTVGGRNVNWSVVSGSGSLAFTTGASANPVGTAAVVTATTKAGNAQVRVTDTLFGNRRGNGTIRVAAVRMRGMTAPRSVPAGTNTASVSVTAAPGGRTVDFTVDNPAVTIGATTVAGEVHSTVITTPAGFKGVVTVTAADHGLPAKTASKRIRFR